MSYKFEVICLIIILIGLGMVAIGISDTGSEYKIACEKLHGKPVYDGRQWVCLKEAT